MVGERVQFDEETWQALDMLARDRTMSFQKIADEAFIDLLRKHDRPVDLKGALSAVSKRGPTPARTSRPDVPRGDGTTEDVCVA
jgi:hypothetical protein